MANQQIRYPSKTTRSESLPEWKDLAASLSGSVEEYSPGGGDWTNVVLNNASSEELKFSRHAFTIPASSIITGIEFTYLIWAESPFAIASDISPPPTDIKDTTVRLLKSGVPVGDNKASVVGWPAYLADYYSFDNFCNGTDGSSINSYTPNIGSVWNIEGPGFTVGTLGSLDGTVYAGGDLVSGNFKGVQLDSSGNGTAWVDTGYSDATGGVVFAPYGENSNYYWSFVFRRTNAFNFYSVFVSNNTRTVSLQRTQGGVSVVLASYTWGSGDFEVGHLSGSVSLLWKISVVWSGSSVSVTVNNILDGYLGFVLNHTLPTSFNENATVCGFQTNSPESWIKKFFVRGPSRNFELRTAGSSSDLWGTTWTPSEINNQASFGSLIQIENLTESDQTAALQSAYITVYYTNVYNEIGRGGVVGGGNIETTFFDNYDGTSGVIASGVAEESAKLGVTEGGVVTSGAADVPFVGPANGGIFVGGVATFVYNEFGSGGVIASGVAYQQWYIPGQGGIVVSGDPYIQSYIISLGGIVVGGQHSQTFIDYVDGIGGAIGGGDADIVDLRIINYEAQSEDDPIIIGGKAGGGIVSVNLGTDGDIKIKGSAVANLSFNLDIDILWKTKAVIKSDFTFLWNLGQLPIYWYRIIGKGRNGSDCNLIADPCCQKFIVNIHARTLSELCDKLRQRNLNLPIESVQRFSRPAEIGAEGFDDECNVLEPVEVCEIPKCADFCVDYENGIDQNTWEFNMTVQVDSFFDYETTDGVFVSGSADVVFEKFLLDFPYIATGEITIDGTSDVVSSSYHYEAQGGVEVSGEADKKSSNWSYVGGEWPSIIPRQYSSDQESLPDGTADQTWSLVERISEENGLYASTDISYIKTSQFLIARNFHLDIPSGSNIVGLKVSVERFATQSGVRDLEVYLVVGDEIISDNLADTTNDWPVGVSFSSKVYGQNGYDGSGNSWSDESLQVSDLTDSGFGVSLRIQSLNSLPAIIANVDYIAVKVFYEDAVHQRLKLGGSSSFSSSSFSYVGDGEIFIGGGADALTTNVFEVVISGGVVAGGSKTYTFNINGSGGMNTGGEAVIDPIWGEGGSVIGGDAKITPYFEIAEGGIIVGGKSLDSWDKKYEATGSISIGGEAFTPEKDFSYESTGGVTIDGTADRSSSAWYWESSENSIFVLGSAGQSASDFGTLDQTAEFSMIITDMIVTFASDQHLGDAVGLNENVRQCGCLSVPLIINFEHNFVRDNILAQFLIRNNFVLSNRLQLYFSRTNTSWQSNLHYKGLSADANNQEIWDIVFELQCTSVVGSIEIGRNIWKLSIQFFRKNLNTGEDFDTRIILGVLPEPICGTSSNELNFTVTYDTQSDVAVVDPTATIYQSYIFDNIGLFKKPSWIENPDLTFTVSQTGLNIPQVRIDLTEDVLNPLNLLPGEVDPRTGVIWSDVNISPTQLQNQN